MVINKLAIFSATQKSKPEDTSLWKSIKDLDIDADLHFFLENTRSLAEVYNEALEIARLSDEHVDAVILVHDDVWLEHDPTPKLEKLFDGYDLVGVAGASEIKLESPALWHIMGEGYLHGSVQHIQYNRYHFSPMQGYYSKPATTFGQYPHRAVMIDGVFMAINRRLIDSYHRFDENIPSKFHFYDLDYSLGAAMRAGYKVGVGDILITHESPGLREYTSDWKAGEQYFLEKYNV